VTWRGGGSEWGFGMLNRGFNVITIDRKRDYVHLIREFEDLLVLSREDIRFNIFEERGGWKSAVKVVCDENYFQASSKPILEPAVRTCLIKNDILKDGKFTDSENYPTYSEGLVEVNRYAKTLGRMGNITTDVVFKMNERIEQYIQAGEIFNCKIGYPLKFWLNNDIVIDSEDTEEKEGLSDEELRTFTIGLAHRILRHFKSNNLRGKELRTLFVIDEGGWLFDSERDGKDYVSNVALGELMRMGREFGIGWIIGGQQPNMFSKVIRQNARFVISFPVQSESMDVVKSDFGLDDDQTKFMMHKLPSAGEGIFLKPDYPGGPVHFGLNVGRPLEKNVTEEELRDHMKPILDGLLEDLRARTEKIRKPKAYDYAEQEMEVLRKEINKEGRDVVLGFLVEERFATRTDIQQKLRGNQARLRRAIEWLKENGLVEEIECYTSHKPSLCYPLTEKAHDLLQTPKNKRAPRASRFKHVYYQLGIKKWLDETGTEGEQGAEAIIEYPRTADFNDRIDVFFEKENLRSAYEVVLTTFDYLKPTIIKCFEKIKVDDLYIVCEPEGMKTVEKRLTKPELSKLLKKYKDRIKVRDIREFLVSKPKHERTKA